MPRKSVLLLGFFMIAVLMMAACTAGPNPSVDIVRPDGDVAGFWDGLWHGIIAPLTFVISIFFDSNVQFYEVHNNGAWYNFGFVLGAGLLFGGSGAAASRMGGA